MTCLFPDSFSVYSEWEPFLQWTELFWEMRCTCALIFFYKKKNRSYIQNSPRLLPKWVPEIFQVFGSNWSGIRDCRRKERRFYLVIQGWGPCVGDMRGCGGLVLVMWSCGVLCCWWGAMGPCAGDAVCSLVLVMWGCGVLCCWCEAVESCVGDRRRVVESCVGDEGL